ncbi:MAG: S8 family peptidase [Polyangia bacterium]
MRSRLTVFCTIALVAALAVAASPVTTTAAEPEKKIVPGEILVKFKSGYQGPGAEAIDEIGARLLEKLSRIDVSRIELPGGISVEQGLARLEKLPFVEYAEPNLIFEPVWAPSDPRWDEQWGIRKIRTPAGWGVETGSSEAVIAIVDTGVDLDHPDLVDRLVAGRDFVDGDARADDVGGHGTHCAGIAAASANNGEGIAGVCPNCSVMPVRVLRPEGGSASNVAKGIIWAADHGADVISLSLGGLFPSSTQLDAMRHAWDEGAILIAAAGNSGVDSPHYPAYHELCLAVAATDRNDQRAGFSNHGSWVDVAAPGSLIVSTVPGGGYEHKNGTSMATPYVAGLAGLLFSRPGATNESVRRDIENSSVPVGGWVAHGRIDVGSALGKKGSSSGGSSSGGSSSGGSPSGGSPSGGSPSGDDGGGIAPTGYSLSRGSTLKAPADSLVSSDDRLLVLRSTQSGKKRYLSAVIKTRLPDPKDTGKLRVVLEARCYDAPTVTHVHLRNWKTGEWDWIGKGEVGVEDTTVEVGAKDASDYVKSDGSVELRFTRSADWWATFEVGIDRIVFYPSAGTGSKGGGSSPGGSPSGGDSGKDEGLSDKLEQKWNKWKKGW